MVKMNQTILLVEDNQALRLIYKNQLAHDGYTVLEAGNTQEAFSQLKTKQIALLLLDIMLPNKSGLTFLQEIRKDQHFQTLPVLMLTSLPDEVGFEQSKQLRIHGYLVKDQVTPQEVSQRIKLALTETQNQPPL